MRGQYDIQPACLCRMRLLFNINTCATWVFEVPYKQRLCHILIHVQQSPVTSLVPSFESI